MYIWKKIQRNVIFCEHAFLKNITRILFLFVLTACVWNFKHAEAASATVTITTEMESIAVGEELKVSLQVEADSGIGYVEAYLDYDKSMLEYITGAEGVSGGNGILKLYDIPDKKKKKRSYSITFRAKKKGNCILAFSEDPSVFEYETEDVMSVSYEDLSVRIDKAVVLSNNTKLISLRVSPGEMEPSFTKKNREYKVYVGADTDRVMVSAEPEEPEATVEVSGNEGLVTGENLVSVMVTAPSGKKRRYKIYVQKSSLEQKVKEPEKQKPKKSTKNQPSTDDFKIKEKNGKIILKNKTSYTLVDLEDSSLIPSGYVRTKLILYGISVTAYTLEEDLENNFILMYAKAKGGSPQFYQYDREEKTMQRFNGSVSSSEITKVVVGDKTDKTTVDDYNSKIKQLSVIVGICASLVVLFALGMISLAIKFFSAKTGKKKDEFL